MCLVVSLCPVNPTRTEVRYGREIVTFLLIMYLECEIDNSKMCANTRDDPATSSNRMPINTHTAMCPCEQHSSLFVKRPTCCHSRTMMQQTQRQSQMKRDKALLAQRTHRLSTQVKHPKETRQVHQWLLGSTQQSRTMLCCFFRWHLIVQHSVQIWFDKLVP